MQPAMVGAQLSNITPPLVANKFTLPLPVPVRLVTVIVNENAGDETAKEISIAHRAKKADLRKGR